MTLILKLSLFNMTWLDRLSCCQWFQCLYARLFVKGYRTNPLLSTLNGLTISVAYVSAMYFEGFIPRAVYPALYFIGTNIGLILKNALPVSVR